MDYPAHRLSEVSRNAHDQCTRIDTRRMLLLGQETRFLREAEL